MVLGLGGDGDSADMVMEHGRDDNVEAMHGGDSGDEAKTIGEAGSGRGGGTMAARMVMERNYQ